MKLDFNWADELDEIEICKKVDGLERWLLGMSFKRLKAENNSGGWGLIVFRFDGWL